MNLVEFLTSRGVLELEHNYTLKGDKSVGYVLYCGGNFVFFHQNLGFVLNRYTRLIEPNAQFMYEIGEDE